MLIYFLFVVVVMRFVDNVLFLCIRNESVYSWCLFVKLSYDERGFGYVKEILFLDR